MDEVRKAKIGSFKASHSLKFQDTTFRNID